MGPDAEIDERQRRRADLACAALIAGVTLYALWRSSIRPLWFDEYVTVYLARLPDWTTLWTAMLDGADGQPPLSYLLTAASMTVFGESPLSVRLSSILAYAVALVAIYACCRRRFGALPALGGVALLSAPTFVSYSFEARPYSLLMAAAALSLNCWQLAQGPRRALALTGLAACLATAVSSHYYAVILWIPLAVAELVRWRGEGRIRWGVPAAMAIGLLPLAAWTPHIASLRAQHSGGFWSEAQPFDAVGFYIWHFYAVGLPLALILIAALVANWKGARTPPAESRLPPGEAVAFIGTALIPALAVVLSLMTTGAFVYRYGVSAAVGLGALFAMLLSRAFPSRPRLQWAAALVLIAPLAFQVVNQPASEQDQDRACALLEEVAAEPREIVIEDPLALPSCAEASPDPVRSRLSYLYAPQVEMERTGAVTAGHTLKRLKPWADFRINEMEPFLASVDEFWVLHSDRGRFAWLVDELDGRGYQPSRSVAADGRHSLLLYSAHDRKTP